MRLTWMTYKEEFENQLKDFVETLQESISTDDGQWIVKDVKN